MPQWELELILTPRVETLGNGTKHMSQNYSSFKVRELEYLYIKSQESMIEDYSSEGAECLLFFPLLAYSIWATWFSIVVVGLGWKEEPSGKEADTGNWRFRKAH